MLIAVAAFVANAESATQAFAEANASPIRKVEPQPASIRAAACPLQKPGNSRGFQP